MRLFSFAAALALTQLASGAELNFQCPARYPEQLTELSVPHKLDGNAVAIVSSGLLLSDGGMITGSPKDDPPAELRGTDEGSNRTRYPVGGIAPGAQPVQSWLFCSYGRGGEVRLFRRVSESVSSCLMRRTSAKGHSSVKVLVTCR